MNVSCSNGFAPWGVVRWQQWSAAVVFLVIEKNGSQVFLRSLKVPKRENFLLAFFAVNEPIWVCDLENKKKIKNFWRMTP